MQIDRKKLIEEERLRNYIRKAIKTIHNKKILEEGKLKEEEDKLKSIIYKLIEADANVAAPHRSTGINVLEDLLKKIIPQIEIEYKKLTTTPDQRASFRSHIVNAIQNSLAPVKVSDKAGSEEEAEQAIDIGLEEDMASALAKSDSEHKSMGMSVDEWRNAIAGLEENRPLYVKFKTGVVNRIVKEGDNDFSVSEPEWKEVMKLDRKKIDDMAVGNPDYEILNLKEGSSYFNEEEDIEIEVGDEETGTGAEEDFIDIDGETEEPSEEEAKEEDFRIDGKDETGRNVAFRAFERIEQAVVDSYNILSDDDDRTLFYDYLITNIKLYFDKFEDEILTALPEPTTPEYEQEKDSQLDSGQEDLGL